MTTWFEANPISSKVITACVILLFILNIASIVLSGINLQNMMSQLGEQVKTKDFVVETMDSNNKKYNWTFTSGFKKGLIIAGKRKNEKIDASSFLCINVKDQEKKTTTNVLCMDPANPNNFGLTIEEDK